MREQDVGWSEPDSPWTELSEQGSPESEVAEFADGSELPAWPAEPSSSRPARPRRGRPSGGVWRSTEPDAPLSAPAAAGRRGSDSAATAPESPELPQEAGAAEPEPGSAERPSTRGGSRRGAGTARRAGTSAEPSGSSRRRGTSRAGGEAPDAAPAEAGGASAESTADDRDGGRRGRKRSGRGRARDNTGGVGEAPAEGRATGSGRSAREGGSAPEGGAAGAGRARGRNDADQSPEAVARDIVYRLLAVRARSRAELRQALLRKEIDEDVADAVLQKFVNANLVNDAEFAEAWVQERQRNQGLGRKALGYELRRKGVDEQLVDAALSTLDSDAEEERARELVRRKLRGSRVDDPTKLLRRLVGMLARKGYSEGLAFRIAKEEVEQHGVGVEDDLDLP